MSTRALAFILVIIWAGATVSVPVLVLWEPFTMPSREGELVSSFEDDLEGWGGAYLQWTNEDSRHGRASLKVTWSNGADNTVYAPPIANALDLEAVIVELQLLDAEPRHAAASLKPVLFFKNKDGGWYQSEGTPLIPGDWRFYRFVVSPKSSGLQPLHIGGAWNGHSARECDTWGLAFSSAALQSATILVDNVRFVRRNSADAGIFALRPGPSSLKTYELYEVAFEVNPEPSNPFDPDSADIIGTVKLPDGTKAQVPAFYYRPYERIIRAGVEELLPSGTGEWRLRYTPVMPGRHELEINGRVEGRSVYAGPLSFEATLAASRGFVRVSTANPRYFVNDDGTIFYPIGHNFRSPTDTRTAKLFNEATPPDTGTFRYEEILPKMSKAGENLFEVWMASWFAEIEWTSEWKNYHGLGRYNLANAWKLDKLIEIAKREGLKLHLVLENHGQVSTWVDDEWNFSPYNLVNGGLIATPDEFWNNKRVLEQYEKKIRYIVARWGYSPEIMGFELVSELDLTGTRSNYKRKEVRDWHALVSSWIRKLDPNKRPITTHYSATFAAIDTDLAKSKHLDYIVGDAYRSDSDIVELLVKSDRFAEKDQMNFGKPYFITEFGGTPFGNSIPSLHADLHAGLWTTYMTDMAGSPLFWWFDLIEREDWYYHFRALANFDAGEDRIRNPMRKLASFCPEKTSALRSMAYGSEDRGYAWVYAISMLRGFDEVPAGLVKNASVAIMPLTEGDFDFEIWDTYSGKIVERGTATVADRLGRLIIPLPDFSGDVALKYSRKKK